MVLVLNKILGVLLCDLNNLYKVCVDWILFSISVCLYFGVYCLFSVVFVKLMIILIFWGILCFYLDLV